jgi:hypothetical protein
MEPGSARGGPGGVLLVAVPGWRGSAVAQAPWEMAVRPAGARGAVPHDADGGATRVDQGQARPPTLRGLAAPGGLERAAPAAVAPAGRPVGVVPPRPARAVARATGPLAPTAAVEARALAPGAAVLRPPPRPRPAAQRPARRALGGRRQPRLVRRPAAPPRLAGTRGRLQTARAAPLPWRTARRAPRDDASEPRRRASPLWRAHAARWPRAPGRGPGWARTVRQARPEVGPRKRRPRAAWVGVAPRHGARGPRRGRRTRGGGRAHGHTVVDLGPLVATRATPRRHAFSQRLGAAGKGKNVAWTAWRPQLLPIRHAMLQQRTPWQAQEVQG